MTRGLHRRSQRGSAAPLLLAVVALTMVGAAAVSGTGAAAVDRARADATADLTALAAATGGEAAARAVTDANRTQLVQLVERRDGAVQVDVERSGIPARAAARAAPTG